MKSEIPHIVGFLSERIFLLHLQLFLIVGVGVKKSSIIVRNFSKKFQILHCEEFWSEKWDSFSTFPFFLFLFYASDDTFEIFDIFANDDLVQAW